MYFDMTEFFSFVRDLKSVCVYWISLLYSALLCSAMCLSVESWEHRFCEF